jgi:hypothetical protein
MVTKDTNKIKRQQTFLNLFSVQEKPIELSYSGEKISSDGGLLLLKEVENQVNIIKSFSSCITDGRDQRYVEHTIESLVSQRVFQIASGYEDANDCNSLRHDAIFKVCSDQLPETGNDLGSQPTMSRFENSVRRSELYRIAQMFVLNFINSYESEPPVIIIDPDDTNHTAYGSQLQIEFNNYYGDYVFMPLHIYEGLSGKLISTILKPGRRSKSVNVFAVLKRIIELIREHWKNTIIVVRGDSHFHSSELTSYSKKDGKIILITGLTGNARLNKLCETTINSAKKKFEKTKEPVKVYHSFAYKAESWEEEERVIVKVEVSHMGANIRYIATNNWEYRTRQMYEMGYCARGSMELRIKDHKTYLKSDRSSCHKFEANQVRLFLHSVAYVLIHTLQKEVLRGTEFANATMQTIRLKLLKTAARVKELKTKIKIEFPRTCPVKGIQKDAFEMFEVLRC